MKVHHIGTLPLCKMGSVTRDIVARCAGAHTYSTKDEPLPEADVYVLHCFKKEHEFFEKFERPEGKLLVSLVHSTEPCAPAKQSDLVVCLTHWSAWEVGRRCGKDPVVIPAGVDLATYAARPSYERRVMGRVTRNAPGKFHPAWNAMLSRLLDIPGASALMVTDKTDGLLEHDRVEYVTGIKIDDDAGRATQLARMSVAALVHGDFMETFSLGALECMAAGLPVVYTYQPALGEVVGEDQWAGDCADDVESCLRVLLGNEDLRKTYGKLARARAAQFTTAAMVARWDSMLRSVA